MDTWQAEAQQVAQIASGVQRLSTVLGRIADKSLESSCGFSNSQFKLLWVLYHHQGGVPQKSIAQWLNQTEAAISRQIQILRRQGLIERLHDPSDQRKRIIRLTDDGKAFTESATQTLIEQFAPHFGVLSQTEQQQFIEMLQKLFFAVCQQK